VQKEMRVVDRAAINSDQSQFYVRFINVPTSNQIYLILLGPIWNATHRRKNQLLHVLINGLRSALDKLGTNQENIFLLNIKITIQIRYSAFFNSSNLNGISAKSTAGIRTHDRKLAFKAIHNVLCVKPLFKTMKQTIFLCRRKDGQMRL
jgi:hypothetical protein